MRIHYVAALLAGGMLVLPFSEALAQTTDSQRRPENAVSAFEVAPGLEVKLFASEPMMSNPTNMAIDHKGRVWIAEGYNYRMELNPNNPVRDEGDRILILEDTNGDGRADESKVYYQGTDINSALGVFPMGNKLIVSASPNVFLFTDEDGDDRPDKKEVLFTGLSGEQHDHAVHAFTFGPDGKLYFNFGNAGGQLRDANGNVVMDKSGVPITDEGKPFRQGMVFRLNPDGSEVEVLGHNFRNNYEVALDSYGTLWQSDNDDDGNRGVRINYVMEYGNYGYQDEMTGASWDVPRTNMEEEIPLRHWHLNDPGVVPNLLQTGAGSPTGMEVYEGRLLPKVFWDQMIHSDAGPNVVRAYPVEKDGAGYAARIENIVTSEDQWFRPSDVAVAPDGSLFIADWYDPGVGGHQVGDLNRGRVFRVAPPNTPYRVPTLDLSTPEAAVEALKSPNVSTRYVAWTRLNEWGAQAENVLKEMWESDPNPRYRARALWLLTKIPGRGDHYVKRALRDEDPDLRITGLRAARQLDGVDVLDYVEVVVDDPSPQVRREAAIALRHNGSPEAAELWAELARQHDGEDRWYLEALGIGADRNWDAFFEAWLDEVEDDWNTPAGRDIVWRARAETALPLLAELIADPNTTPKERLRYFRAFDFHTAPSKQDILISLLEADHPDQPQITALALQHMDGSVLTKSPLVKPALERTLLLTRGTQEFVELVDRFDLRDQNEALLEIILKDPDSDLGISAAQQLLEAGGMPLLKETLGGANEQNALAAAMVLGHLGNDAAADLLRQIIMDAASGMEVRRAAVRAYGRGWHGENRLLALVAEGRLPEELEPAAAGVLLQAYRQNIRADAAKYLDVPQASEGKPLPPIHELMARQGDPARGKEVFALVCASCHVVNGTGTNFGPALSEIGSKLPEEGLYHAILHPDAGISFGFEGYNVQTKDGAQIVGYIASETADAVEVRQPGGITTRIARADITSRTPLEHSLMPSGLEQAMTEQDLVDLVDYLQTLRSPTSSR